MTSAATPVSVVVSTLDRTQSLRRTLAALRYQRHPTFEVIVVDGPAADDSTEHAVAEFGDTIRYLRCPEVNLSKSRNIGIDAASGEIVAFIDDDAVPEPRWLAELVAAFDSPRVAGAGGTVYDHTGARIQYLYSLSDRVGFTYYDREPPFADELLPGADPFVYLQGTNMSFRRDILAESGGFDEEIEYNFDEVEVCLRILDGGHEIRPLASAAVHHKSLPSHVRNQDRLVTDPYFAIKNRAYFALRYGRPSRSTDEVIHLLHTHAGEERESARRAQAAGKLDQLQCEFFLSQIDRGLEHGLSVGLESERQSANIRPRDPDAYRQFDKHDASSGHLNACFVSQKYPPDDFGAVGRYTSELAQAFADQGHEVHVFTGASDGVSTVDFEGGVWRHRVHVRDRRVPELRGIVAAGILYVLAARYQEARRLHKNSPIDFVSAPLWLSEGLCCGLDDHFPTVTTVLGSIRTAVHVDPSMREDPHADVMLRLEAETLSRSRHLHAITEGVLDRVRSDYRGCVASDSFIVPLGIADRAGDVSRPGGERPSDDLTVLFVGRLERQKGVDVLLEAISTVAREFPRVSFVIAGRDNSSGAPEWGYRQAFERAHAEDPDLLRRVSFTGEVAEAKLWELYERCDIFCAPSRSESSGLVLVEAMMFGKPVIGGAVEGMREVIDDQVTGLLAQPDDVESLTGCLRRLLGDRELRQRCAAGGRARFLDRYELQRVTPQAFEAYRAVAERHRRMADAPEERIREEFASIIATVAGLSREQADSAAERLLDADAYPIDHVGELREAWSQSPQEFVSSVYDVILNRRASAAEIGPWIEGAKRPDWRMKVVSGIARSREARNLHVPIGWLEELERHAGPVRGVAELASALQSLDTSDDVTFVEGAHEHLLGRHPDPAGRQMWLAQLQSGASRLDLVRGIAVSDEAHARGVDAGELLARLGESDPVPALRRAWQLPDPDFLRITYHAILLREPDRSGFEGYLRQIAWGRSRSDIVREIALSRETRSDGGDTDWLAELEASPPPGGAQSNPPLRAIRDVANAARRARRHLRRLVT